MRREHEGENASEPGKPLDDAPWREVEGEQAPARETRQKQDQPAAPDAHAGWRGEGCRNLTARPGDDSLVRPAHVTGPFR